MRLPWEDTGTLVLSPVFQGLIMTLRLYRKGNEHKDGGFALNEALQSYQSRWSRPGVVGLVRWGLMDHEEVAVAYRVTWTWHKTFINQTCCAWNPG